MCIRSDPPVQFMVIGRRYNQRCPGYLTRAAVGPFPHADEPPLLQRTDLLRGRRIQYRKHGVKIKQGLGFPGRYRTAAHHKAGTSFQVDKQAKVRHGRLPGGKPDLFFPGNSPADE